MAEPIVYNTDVEQIHQSGVSVAQNNYGLARERYIQAKNLLEASYVNDALTRDLHRTRIERDEVMLTARRAIMTQSSTPDLTQRRLEEARHAATQSAKCLHFTQYNERLKDTNNYRHFCAEQSASTSVMARIMVAKVVASTVGTDKEMSRGEIKTALKGAYKPAHKWARRGDNAYYRTSNAMHAARAEQLLGHRVRSALWVARGGLGVVAALAKDRQNFRRSAETFARNIPLLHGGDLVRTMILAGEI